MKEFRKLCVATDAGWVAMAATRDGLVALNLPAESRERAEKEITRLLPPGMVEVESLSGGAFTDASLEKLGRDTGDYFRGKPVAFDSPIDWAGCRYTPFQEKALRECYQVPYGRAVTYGQIARAIGNPKASRAVGMAMHINRVSLVVP